MGENCGSWFPQLQFDCQSPNLKSLTAPRAGQQETAPVILKPNPNMISTDGISPENPKSLHFREGQVNEPYGWFYCLPRFRQGFTPLSNSIVKEQLPAGLYGNHGESLMPSTGPDPAQKRFLVFEQSGDQTTLIFSSGVGTPVQYPTWGQKPTGACNFNEGFPGTKVGLDLQSEPVKKLDENNETGFPSEMHEDTEELNALLYSADDSDYTEDDDEVTSTGHSPSAMTAHDQQDGFEVNSEEVGSSAGPLKKRKQLDGDYNEVPSLVDTASSVRLNRSIVCEDDAESCCANENKHRLNTIDYLSGTTTNKMKKRKIRETVSVLQSLLPVGKGEDVILVLDKAISYLKSLRNNAEALGHVSP
jgi:hypothetical protein